MLRGVLPFVGRGALAPPGQVILSTPGAGTWTVPAGVYSICVVAVGPGGEGGGIDGGGGGALTYANNIAVTPGQVINFNVGVKGVSNTWFVSTTSLSAGRGGFSSAPEYGYGGVSSGTLRNGGGNGGVGGGSSGGAGAGGYSGDGTNGVSEGSSSAAATGGAASGGSQGQGGGGVGVKGQGPSGATSGPYNPGKAGSNGSDGVMGDGGNYGGGAVGPTPGLGAIRIIWGAGRAFPSTNTADV